MSMSTHIMDLMLTSIVIVLKQANIDDAQTIARQIVDEIQRTFGGSRPYIPLSDSDQRNAEIKKAFSGNNHAEICKCYGISLRTLYRIINK